MMIDWNFANTFWMISIVSGVFGIFVYLLYAGKAER